MAFFNVRFRKRNKQCEEVIKLGVPMGIKRCILMFDLYYYYALKGILFIMDLLVIYIDDTTMIDHQEKRC